MDSGCAIRMGQALGLHRSIEKTIGKGIWDEKEKREVVVSDRCRRYADDKMANTLFRLSLTRLRNGLGMVSSSDSEALALALSC